MIKYMVIVYLTTGSWAYLDEPMSRETCIKAAEQLPKVREIAELPLEKVVCHEALQEGSLVIVNNSPLKGSR